MLLQLDPTLDRSLQEQLVDQIRARIADGRLPPGRRLPSTRALATELGVSRNTVAFAYDHLLAEGYLSARRGTGTFVSDDPPEAFLAAGSAQPAPADADEGGRRVAPAFRARQHVLLHEGRLPIDFWVQRTDPGLFPTKTWRRHLGDCLAYSGTNLTDYGDPLGLPELRAVIAERVAALRGIAVGPDQVFVVAGAQLALNLVARLFLRGGETVVVETPCNQGAAYLFEGCGATLLPVPLDRDGLLTDRLPDGKVTLAYTTPSHQFPLGVTLSLERRQALLRWAAAAGAYVVEDDYDSHFFYEERPLPALKALRDDLVIHLGTFSKSLGAGLRLGYAVLPKALVPEATAAKALLDNGPPWLEQAALARFIGGGGFDRHLRRIRQVYLDRRDCLLAAMREHFGAVELLGAGCGTHVSWVLPQDWPEAPVIEAAARAARVGVYTLPNGGGQEYGEATRGDRTLMLGYATLSPAQIRHGVAILADVIRHLRRGG